LLIKRATKGAADDAQAAELRRLLDKRPGKVSAALTRVTGVCADDLLCSLAQTTTSAQAQPILRQLRWRLTKTRLLRHPILSSRRLFLDAIRRSRRLTLPTGFFVVLIGPDGCGKSTVADALLTVLARGFRRTARFHWRPGLLPRLGRGALSDSERASPPATYSRYRGLASLARFLYYSFDFVVGYWLRLYPWRARTGLIIGERYYADVRVNPARYGFDVPQWLSEFVATLVPKPDLTVLLTGEAEVIHGRKRELSAAAIHDQLKRFEAEIPRWGEHTILKTDIPAAAVAGVIADHILALCEARTAKRLERSGSDG
jgi:thymidylate kinase